MSSKRKLKQKHADLYYAERMKTFMGEEEFMNTMHPFEETGKDSGKKSSPIQKAMIACIKAKGGSATEEELLEFVEEKWDIINKYSERGFATNPTIRIIRLNCAVKKKARHLFLRDPNNSAAWILNSSPRKSPCKKLKLSSRNIVCESEQSEVEKDCVFSTLYDDSSNEQDAAVMPDATFERHVENLIKESRKQYTFSEICGLLMKHDGEPGIFASLPFKRRVRACLVVLKSEQKAIFDGNTNLWRSYDFNGEYEGRSDPEVLSTPPQLKPLTLDEFYMKIKSGN
jgi:hypothetical protein